MTDGQLINPNQAQLVFVVGNSRSGTTMMGRVLGQHSAIFTFEELHFFEQLWSPQKGIVSIPIAQAIQLAARLFAIQRHGYYRQGNPQDYIDEAKVVISDLSDPITAPHVFEAFLKYETGRQGKTISCDQTPRNVYYLQEILELYPRAFVVNMIRDPRAVLLSQKNKWRRRFFDVHRELPLKQILRIWANYHPLTMSLLWRSGIQAGDHLAHHPRILQVKFEGLVVAPEEAVRRICAFLGIEFQLGMLDVPQVGSSNRPDRLDRKGIDSSVADSWKRGALNETEIFISQSLTKRGMIRHRYEFAGTRPNPFALAYYGVTWGLKLGLAFLLNIRRAQNIFEAIRRRLAT